MITLGVDIGGTGIKGCLVDTEKGVLIGEKIRIETPHPVTPESVVNAIKDLASKFKFDGPIGCGFPATVHHGVAYTASNIDKSWIGTPVEKLFTEELKHPCYVINDADAAGTAEIMFGTGKNKKGVVIMITIGTGLGSAIFNDGKLLPNTELGHIILNDDIAEHYCSDAARHRFDLNWNKWGKRFNNYLERLVFLFSPDLIILGGGTSKSFEKYKDKITVNVPVVPAFTLNAAGIIGAAVYAHEKFAKGELPNTNPTPFIPLIPVKAKDTDKIKKDENNVSGPNDLNTEKKSPKVDKNIKAPKKIKNEVIEQPNK